jgi:hypothetical protein
MATKKTPQGDGLVKTRRAAGYAARARLVEAHQDEFRVLLREELELRGLEIEPTPQERADAQMQKLLAEFPGLGVKYNLGPAEPENVAGP